MRFLLISALFLSAVYLSQSRSIATYDATTDELKNQVDNLKKQAQDAIQKLMAQGKIALAGGIKNLETHLIDLESQLEKLNPQTEVGKALLKSLEALVKGAETKLEEEIKKLSGGFYADDMVRAALMKDVGDLYDQVKAGIEELAKTGKTELINGLDKAIKFIEVLKAKVMTLEPTTDLGKAVLNLVEQLAVKGEDILKTDLKKAQGPMFYAADPDKEALLALAGKIYDEGKAGYEKLAKEDKKVVINALTKTVALIKEAETDLMSLHPTTTIGKTILTGVEKLVKQIETVLDMDLKALEKGPQTYDATTDELKNQIDNLKKQAQDAIQKLMAQGKTALAGGIKALETHLIDLESQLEKLNPQTEVGKALLKSLEALVKGAETKLEEEIKKLSGGFYADDPVRPEIMKIVSDLYDQVGAGIEELAKTSKTELVNGLEKVIKFLDSVSAKLTTLKPTTDVGKAVLHLVEQLAVKGEEILKADLKKAQGAFYAVDPDKEALLALAGKIYDEGKAAYDKLAKEDKTVAIDGLTKTIAFIEEIKTDMKTLNPTTTIGKNILTRVEAMVNIIESITKIDLAALQKGF
jgi:cell division protein FtsB